MRFNPFSLIAFTVFSLCFAQEAKTTADDTAHLTIDPHLQAALEECMREVKGTAVIIDA